MTASVLIIDDDLAIRESLERALRLEGYSVTVAVNGLDGVSAVKNTNPDLVVLDLGLPDIDGMTVCRRLRQDSFEVPICILSARDQVSDRVEGLRVGADDYLVKPFALDELLARLEAMLRRRPVETDRINVGPLVLDPPARSATMNLAVLDLTRREFDLLETLAVNAGVVLSRDRLLELVWGYDFETETNVVDVFVGYLRKKLEVDGQPRMIQTVRGIGFVLKP